MTSRTSHWFFILGVTAILIAPVAFASTGDGLELIGPNGKAIKGAELPSPSGEDLKSLGRRQSVLKEYYIPSICGAKKRKKESPAIQAIRTHDMGKLSALAKKKKFNANQTDLCGMTAVQNAILYGDGPTLQLLLDHGAKLTKTNRQKRSGCDLLSEVDDLNLARFRERCSDQKQAQKSEQKKDQKQDVKQVNN